MNFRSRLKSGQVILFDGAMGTVLQKRGMRPGTSPEMMNLTDPDMIRDIHKKYIEAGADVITSNTFGCDPLKYSTQKLEKMIHSAMDSAKQARAECGSGCDTAIAFDIGPLSEMLVPSGKISFSEAVELFKKLIIIGAKDGADLILAETMTDLYQVRAAVIAARECCDLPVIASCTFGKEGRMLTGASPETACTVLNKIGCDAVGINCSFGPDHLKKIVRTYLELSELPVLLQPNAGLPVYNGSNVHYSLSARDFADKMKEYADQGVALLGGCCGTDTEYIASMAGLLKGKLITERHICSMPVITGPADAVFPKRQNLYIIGERINPTGKKKMKEALREGNISYILDLAASQEQDGADILDINCGLSGINEKVVLPSTVTEVQNHSRLPLQLDTSDPEALANALRVCNGIPIVNSVNGTEKSMRSVLPLIKKYGGMLVALTLDENGIPDSVEGRIKIAEKIAANAASYGIDRSCLIFDPLAMSVSADNKAARITLDTLKTLHEAGYYTALGISNISFGLPERDELNAAFLLLAIENGLNFAIVNPSSIPIRRAISASLVLNGKDTNCTGYIKAAVMKTENDHNTKNIDHTADSIVKTKSDPSGLYGAILTGMNEKASALTEELLKNGAEPLSIINETIIPALDSVGIEYAQNRLFLPQLLQSADAAAASFDVLKNAGEAAGKSGSKKRISIVLATVHGDIHDIGKNIVKLLLENYNFDVHDLGKDVKPEVIVSEICRINAPLCGLSALMTTTLPAMEETIHMIKSAAPFCRIVAGGAVLNSEYAAAIGADFYAKDAMDTVRYAEETEKNLMSL